MGQIEKIRNIPVSISTEKYNWLKKKRQENE
jgi:hypothetical protein